MKWLSMRLQVETVFDLVDKLIHVPSVFPKRLLNRVFKGMFNLFSPSFSVSPSQTGADLSHHLQMTSLN